MQLAELGLSWAGTSSLASIELQVFYGTPQFIIMLKNRIIIGINILFYFPKVSLCDLYAVCVCPSYKLFQDWTKLNTIISAAHFINPSHHSVLLSASLSYRR
jgi:hypothetical protein